MRPLGDIEIPGIPGIVQPQIHTPADVRRVQQHILAVTPVIDTTVTNCGTADENTRAGWGAFRLYALDYTGIDPTPTGTLLDVLQLEGLYKQGISIAQQLDAWVDHLNGLGCQVPILAPKAPPGLWDHLSYIGKALTAAALVSGGIYLAIKVADIIEKAE